MDNNVAEVMLRGLQQAYEERVVNVGRALQGAVDALPRDPVLQQMAKDSGSALHITPHIEGALRSALAREAEHAAQRSMHAAAKSEARAEYAEKELCIIREQLLTLRHEKAQNDIVHAGGIDQLRREVHGLRSTKTTTTIAPRPLDESHFTSARELLEKSDHLSTKHTLDERSQEVSSLRAAKKKLKRDLANLRNELETVQIRAGEITEENVWLHEERARVGAQYGSMAARLEKAVSQGARETAGVRQTLQHTEQENARLRAHLTESEEAAKEAARSHTHSIATLNTQLETVHESLRTQERLLRDAEVKEMVEARLRPLLDASHQRSEHPHPPPLPQPMTVDSTPDAKMMQEKLQNLETRLTEKTEELKTVSEQAKADLVEMSGHLKKLGEAKQRSDDSATDLRIRLAEAEHKATAVEERQQLCLDAAQYKEELRILRTQLEEERKERRSEAKQLSRRASSVNLNPEPTTTSPLIHPTSPPRAPTLPLPSSLRTTRPVSEDSESQEVVEELRIQAAQVEGLVSQTTALQGELQHSAAALGAAEAHLQMTQQQLRDAEGAHATQMSENHKLLSKCAALESARKSEQTQRSTLEDDIATLQRKFELQSSDLLHAENDKAVLAQSESELRVVVANLEKSLVDIVEDKDGGVDEDDKMFSQWREEHQELVELRVRLKHCVEENGGLQTRLETLQRQVDADGAMRTKVDKLQESLSERDTETQRARSHDAATILSLRNAIDTVRTELSAVKSENTQLEQTLSVIHTETQVHDAQSSQEAQLEIQRLHSELTDANRAQVCPHPFRILLENFAKLFYRRCCSRMWHGSEQS